VVSIPSLAGAKTIADRWGTLAGQSKLQGKALTMADGIILAAALEHDLIIVTRNVKDFCRVRRVDIQSLGRLTSQSAA
jgi:predicted nucleic acid-binding protein